MIRRTVTLISYLLLSLSLGISATLVIDRFENIAAEKELRRALVAEIRNAEDSFHEASGRVTPDEEMLFIRKFVAGALKDKVIAVDPVHDPRPDANDFKFLFSFARGSGKVDLYISASFLRSELRALDMPEMIAGLIIAIVFFGFMVLYAEKRRQTTAMRVRYEKKDAEFRKTLEEQEALALMGRMAATLAHEMKTPIATISNLIQVLPSRISEERFVGRFLSITREELARTQQLIDNLLVYGKEIDIKAETWISLRPFLLELCERNRLLLGACPDASIYGDGFYMALLFENLLRNSDTAGAKEVWVRIAPVDDDLSADILFEDNGGGFPAGCDLEELCGPFVTNRPKGAGLGLYLARKVALAHEGELSLYRLEHGAGVRMKLPKKRMRVNER